MFCQLFPLLINPFVFRLLYIISAWRKVSPRIVRNLFNHFAGLALKGLRLCQISMMEFFLENCWRLEAVNYFHKEVLWYIFDRFTITPYAHDFPIDAFFTSNVSFSTQPQCCLTFSWIELQMLLSCCLKELRNHVGKLFLCPPQK